jgi:Rrf2 family iron-sulfur cluster assembly transcriptional regulator
MRITQWGEYGVLFSVAMGRFLRAGTDLLSAQDIATSQGVALHYSQQILLRLKDGGIVESIRGPRGGYRLARQPEEITLRDIIIASEGKTLEVICESKPLDEERCNPSSDCSLRGVWYGLRQHVDEYLSGISLAQLLADPEIDVGPIQIGESSGVNVAVQAVDEA